MPYGVLNSGHLQRRRSLEPGQPRSGRERGHQPRHVPQLQRAERHHALRLQGRVELRLDAAHAEPADRAPASSTSWPTPSARADGTLGGEYSIIDPYDPKRTYGVLNEDRTHVLNVSWNAFLPDGATGAMNNAVGRGLLNGWQLSGISSMASGVPLRLSFSGDAAGAPIAAAYFGTADVVGPSNTGGNGLAPSLHVRSAPRRNRRRRQDSRHQLHLRARPSASSATSCRRTTSGRRRGSTTT